MTTIYEAYTGPFTGVISNYTSPQTGLRYTFKAPCPRIEHKRVYVVKIEEHRITLLPVLWP